MHLSSLGLRQCLLLSRRLLDLRRDRRLPPWVLHVVPPNREATKRFRDLDLVLRERFRPPLSDSIVYMEKVEKLILTIRLIRQMDYISSLLDW